MTRIISIVGGLQPSTPTIGTATDGGTGTSANVAFTASSYIGKGTITYTATSSPGGLTGTSATSPISVTGLTTGTAYTFTVVGTTNYGVSSLTSGSSNSITPANPDPGAMFPIGAVTVGSAGAASITFSSIPSTYTHLQIRAFQKTSSAGDLSFRINGDGSANYSRHYLYGDGTSSIASGGSATAVDFGYIGYNPTGTYYQTAIINILDYKNTNKNKTVRSSLGTDANGSGYILTTSSAWLSTAAITSIVFTTVSDFSPFSQFALYGIKGA